MSQAALTHLLKTWSSALEMILMRLTLLHPFCVRMTIKVIFVRLDLVSYPGSTNWGSVSVSLYIYTESIDSRCEWEHYDKELWNEEVDCTPTSDEGEEFGSTH